MDSTLDPCWHNNHSQNICGLNGPCKHHYRKLKTKAAQKENQNTLSQLVQGYDTGFWFQPEHHVAGLGLYGLFYKGGALVIVSLSSSKSCCKSCMTQTNADIGVCELLHAALASMEP